MGQVELIRRRVTRRSGSEHSADVVQTEIVSADGLPLTLMQQGHGHTIVTVHPGSGNWAAWQLVSERLRARFRVLAFDRRPYAASPERVAASSIKGEVDDVQAAARFAAEPVLLVGHSSGGVVALEAALAAPSAFAGLVLYEPPVAVTKPLGGEALRKARAALDAGDPDKAMEIHLHDLVRFPWYMVRLQRLILPLRRQMRTSAAGQIIDDEEIESLGIGVERYTALHVPTLLLGGAKSPRHLRDRLNALSDVLPCVDSVVILKGQGHLANAFAPDKVAQAIEEFANRLAW